MDVSLVFHHSLVTLFLTYPLAMKAVNKHLDLGLLIARIGMRAGFIYYHGWDKLMGGVERWEGLGGAMARFGLDF